MELTKVKLKRRKQILKTIRDYTPISSADISRKTGVHPSTITFITKELISDNVILKCGKGKSTSKGGKPSEFWELNSGKYFFLGIAINFGKIRWTVLDFKGNPIEQDSVSIENKSIDEVEDVIAAIYREHIEGKYTNIKSLGITVPGEVNSGKGEIVFSRLFNCRNYPFLTSLRSKIPCRLYLENDSNACALATIWTEKISDPTGICMLINMAPLGIGSGVIIKNELYHSKNHKAGEVLANSDLIEEKYQSLVSALNLTNPAHDVFLSTLTSQIAQNNGEVIGIMEDLMEEFSKEIYHLANFLDSSFISFAGDILLVDNQVIETLKNKIISLYSTHNLPVPEFIVQASGGYKDAIGAAMIGYKDMFVTEEFVY